MLAQLLVDGVVGPIRIGQSREELLSRVGPPPAWNGKPGSFPGGKIEDYAQSNEWIYNGISVVIYEGVVDELNIWFSPLHYVDFQHPWFAGWNFPPVPKLSNMMEYLNTRHIPFRISSPRAGRRVFGYDLILEKGCILGMPQENPTMEEIEVNGIMRVREADRITRSFPEKSS